MRRRPEKTLILNCTAVGILPFLAVFFDSHANGIRRDETQFPMEITSTKSRSPSVTVAVAVQGTGTERANGLIYVQC